MLPVTREVLDDSIRLSLEAMFLYSCAEFVVPDARQVGADLAGVKEASRSLETALRSRRRRCSQTPPGSAQCRRFPGQLNLEGSTMVHFHAALIAPERPGRTSSTAHTSLDQCSWCLWCRREMAGCPVAARAASIPTTGSPDAADVDRPRVIMQARLPGRLDVPGAGQSPVLTKWLDAFARGNHWSAERIGFRSAGSSGVENSPGEGP